MTGAVLAHGAEAHGTAVVESAVLLGVAGALAVVYLAGARQLVTPGRTTSWSWRRWAFLSGLAVAVLALFPPLDPVVDASFPAHMTQHMLLLLVASPLLALGAPGLPLLLALPRRWRRPVAVTRSSGPARAGRALVGLPAFALAAHAVVLWGWHLPVLYTAALTSPPVHMVEHVCFLAAGWLLWSVPARPGAPLTGGPVVLYVVAAGLPATVLGVALTFAPRPLYPAQTGTGPVALVQQQLAGLIMWIPGDVTYLTVCAVLVLLWLRRLDREAPATVPLPPPELPEHDRAGLLLPSHGEGPR